MQTELQTEIARRFVSLLSADTRGVWLIFRLAWDLKINRANLATLYGDFNCGLWVYALVVCGQNVRNGWKVNFNAAHPTWHANGMANETRQKRQLGNGGGNNNTSSKANENISSAMPQPKAIDITYTQCLTETPHSNGASQLAKLTKKRTTSWQSGEGQVGETEIP